MGGPVKHPVLSVTHVARLLARVPPERAALVTRHVVGGETLTALGAKTGVTGTRIGLKIGKALDVMRGPAG